MLLIGSGKVESEILLVVGEGEAGEELCVVGGEGVGCCYGFAKHA